MGLIMMGSQGMNDSVWPVTVLNQLQSLSGVRAPTAAKAGPATTAQICNLKQDYKLCLAIEDVRLSLTVHTKLTRLAMKYLYYIAV